MPAYGATSLPGVPAGRTVTIRKRPGGEALATSPSTLTTTAGLIPAFSTADPQTYAYAAVQGFSTVLVRPTTAPVDQPTGGVAAGSGGPFTLASGFIAGTDEAQCTQQYRTIGAAGANFQKAHTLIADDALSIRLVYGNFWGNDEPYDNPVTVKAGVYLWVDASGAHRPVTFGGRDSVTIAPGGFAISDPVAAEFRKGDSIVTTTYAEGGATGGVPANYYTGAGVGNRKDATPAHVGQYGDWSSNAAHWGYGPMAVLVKPSKPASHLLAVIGDSIVYGFGDYPTHVGFVTRAALRDGVPFVKVAMPSESAGAYAQPQYGYQRRTFSEGSTHALVNYGANDSGFRSVAQFKADITRIWEDLAARGVKVVAMTVGPKTDSTDGWATVGNQSSRPTNGAWSTADLAGVNTWIRSKPSPAISKVWDYADVVMSGRDSNRWKPNFTGDGTHPSEPGHAALAAALDLKALLG